MNLYLRGIRCLLLRDHLCTHLDKNDHCQIKFLVCSHRPKTLELLVSLDISLILISKSGLTNLLIN